MCQYGLQDCVFMIITKRHYNEICGNYLMPLLGGFYTDVHHLGQYAQSLECLLGICYKCFIYHATQKYMTEPGKTGLNLPTQNTCICIMARISCSVCAIRNRLVLLNLSWISAYMMTF